MAQKGDFRIQVRLDFEFTEEGRNCFASMLDTSENNGSQTPPERIKDADAIIAALTYIALKSSAPWKFTGDILRVMQTERKLHVQYEKETDTYIFSAV